MTYYLRRGDVRIPVVVGQDVSEFLSITKYEPPVPMGMSGEVTVAYEFAVDFDIENDKNFPGFLDNDEVEATEKLHGTNFRIAYRPDAKNDELFAGGKVGIASKSLGAKGLMFKNNRVNLGPLWVMTPEDYKQDKREARRWKWLGWTNRFSKWTGYKVLKPRSYASANLYVRTAVELGLVEAVAEYGRMLGAKVDLFGEIFGAGVQDLHYGATKPQFRAFDIMVDGQYLDSDLKAAAFAALGVERVPVLYRGPFDRAKLEQLRDGTTLIGRKMDADKGPNIREGIVITATGDQTKRDTPDGRHRLRPILKMVSPDYLARKGEATEFE